MYIWQHPSWPQFTYQPHALQAALSSARLAQGRLMGVAAGLGLTDMVDLQLQGWQHEAMATAQIEGEHLALQSVRASAARRLGLTDERAGRDARVEATLDVLQAATHQTDGMISHNDLWAWHAALFPTGLSGVQKIKVGAYRDHAEPMQIVTPSKGRHHIPHDIVHYQAPASADVTAQMSHLLAWLNGANDAVEPMDGLVKAAIAHVWFEAIHPFEDGNGRIGRALCEWVLAQEQKSDLRLFSLSQQLWEQRKTYYAQLQAATSSTHLDVTAWVLWFVGCIDAACTASIERVQKAVEKTHFWHVVGSDISASQRKVLNRLFDAAPTEFANGLSTELYVKISMASRATAFRELTALCDAGLLSRTGVGRGTRYQLRYRLP